MKTFRKPNKKEGERPDRGGLALILLFYLYVIYGLLPVFELNLRMSVYQFSGILLGDLANGLDAKAGIPVRLFDVYFSAKPSVLWAAGKTEIIFRASQKPADFLFGRFIAYGTVDG